MLSWLRAADVWHGDCCRSRWRVGCCSCEGIFVAGFQQHQSIHDGCHVHLLGNADVCESCGHSVMCFASNVFACEFVVDDDLAVASVSGADGGDLHESERRQ